jgi:RNA exonuclease 1
MFTVFRCSLNTYKATIKFCRFSGISAEDLEGVTTSIRDVQAILLSMFTSKTILLGHSLESDLKALKVQRQSAKQVAAY